MKIAYIGNVGVSNTAPAIHVNNRARFMRLCGHQIYILCESHGLYNRMDDLTDIFYDYIKVFPSSKFFHFLFWNLDQIFGFIQFNVYKKHLFKIKPEIVILYEPTSILFVERIKKLGYKYGFKIIIESTEWRNPNDYKGFQNYLINRQKDLQRRYYDFKPGNVIAISDYLYSHYLKNKCNVIKLPPLFELEELPVSTINNRNGSKPIHIVFAGVLLSKDYIDTLISAIIDINKNKINIIFDIIGPSKNSVENMMGILDIKKFGIICHGKLSHDETLKIVAKSDFSVLLRENKLYAKAGVSTKFCEAMCLGVPSICTKIGGTDSYIKNGVNGFLVKNNSKEELLKILNVIINLDNNDLIELKKSALETAEKNFVFDAYIEKFNVFLKNVS